MTEHPILIVDEKRYEVVDFRAPRKNETILSACCRAYLSDEDYPMQDERCILRELPSPVTDGGLERRDDWRANGWTPGTEEALIDAACAVVNDVYPALRSELSGSMHGYFHDLAAALKPFTRPTKTERFYVRAGTRIVSDHEGDSFVTPYELDPAAVAAALNNLSQGEGE